MKLYIGADLVPTEANLTAYRSGDLSEVIDPALTALLQTADYRIFNLECPLTDGGAPIDKCGPALRAPADAVNGLKALGADFVTLANNHILDYGEEGLADTRAVLADAGIAYAGAAEGVRHSGIYKLMADGVTLGIYCCTEHEFSVSKNGAPGAVPFEPVDSSADIAELKKICDRVIVLYHGGREMWQYPTPELRERCHHLVKAGADLIVCQHSHCIGCAEVVDGSTIVYGQGNFHFDLPDEQSELWCTALLLEVNITADSVSADPIPLRLRGHRLTLADDADAAAILDGRNMRSEALADGSYLKKFDEMLDENADYYLSCLSGNYFSGFLPRALNKLTGRRYKKRKLSRMYDREALLRLINYLECETHREVLTDILRRTLDKPER
ncbi:MAG: CapA family protein [Clostridia bacterium]|nr:CapA family protein [Clostridia bacterium]